MTRILSVYNRKGDEIFRRIFPSHPEAKDYLYNNTGDLRNVLRAVIAEPGNPVALEYRFDNFKKAWFHAALTITGVGNG